MNTETNTYKGIKLVSYQQCNFRLVRESLFILKKDDLPNIENLDVKPEDIERYRLNTINAEHRLMAEVNDLHIDDDLRNMLQQNRPNEDLYRSVLAVIAFVTRVRWKKEMKMVSLRVYSEFEDKGLPIDPKEIEKF